MTDKKQSQQTDPNRTYYQRVYEQIHASEELKERLTNMNMISKNNRNKNRAKKTWRITWKTAAAAAALAIVLPTGAYAADHYWGITDFFTQSGHALPDEAGKLIEKDIAQTPQKAETESQTNADSKANTDSQSNTDSQTKTDSQTNTDAQTNTNAKTNAQSKTDADIKTDVKTKTESAATPNENLPVTFTVQEALCDSGAVNIVIEAKAAESGRYLLVPDDCTSEEDSAETIGIHENTSIGAYARSKNLEILYVSSGFSQDSPFFPAACRFSANSVQDDTLQLFISADREASDTDLHAVLSHTVRPAGGNEILKAASAITLNDNSTSRMVAYSPNGSGEVPGTQAVVKEVSIEQTEVNTYVNVRYRDPHAMEKDHGLYFAVLDSNGNEWPSKGGRGIVQLEDGSYCLRLCYQKTELPKTCILQAYDCIQKNTYGQMELTQTEQE